MMFGKFVVKIMFMIVLEIISLKVLMGKLFFLLLLLYDWFLLNDFFILISIWIILFYVEKV